MFVLHSIGLMSAYIVLFATVALAVPSDYSPRIERRDTSCRSIIAKAKSTPDVLATACGVTSAEFNDYNPDPSVWSEIDKPVCCSNGTLSIPPHQESNGKCHAYMTRDGDTCASVAKAYGITEKKIGDYNKDTFAWHGCSNMSQNSLFCISDGEPPMPVALRSAKCGPQKPGTARPLDMSILSSLNPCLGTNCSCDLKRGECVNSETDSDCFPSSGAVIRRAKNIFSETTRFSTIKSNLKETTYSLKTERYLHQEERTIISNEARAAPLSLNTPPIPASLSEKRNSVVDTLSPRSLLRSARIPGPKIKSRANIWSVAFYSNPGCTGDYYYLTGVHEDQGSECLDFHGGVSSDFSSKTWCRWYTDGGSKSSPCTASVSMNPKSWWLSNAACNAYSGQKCTSSGSSGIQQHTSVGEGNCVDYNEEIDRSHTLSWQSLRCNTPDSIHL